MNLNESLFHEDCFRNFLWIHIPAVCDAGTADIFTVCSKQIPGNLLAGNKLPPLTAEGNPPRHPLSHLNSCCVPSAAEQRPGVSQVCRNQVMCATGQPREWQCSTQADVSSLSGGSACPADWQPAPQPGCSAHTRKHPRCPFHSVH